MLEQETVPKTNAMTERQCTHEIVPSQTTDKASQVSITGKIDLKSWTLIR